MNPASSKHPLNSNSDRQKFGSGWWREQKNFRTKRRTKQQSCMQGGDCSKWYLSLCHLLHGGCLSDWDTFVKMFTCLLVIVVIGKAKQKVGLLLVFGSYLNQQVLKLCEAASWEAICGFVNLLISCCRWTNATRHGKSINFEENHRTLIFPTGYHW